MKKAFEFFLILIIFYGVYSAFQQIAPLLAPELAEFWVVVASLVVATLLLLLYGHIIATQTRGKIKATVSELESEIKKKNEEIKTASSFKEALVEEAEKTIPSSIQE